MLRQASVIFWRDGTIVGVAHSYSTVGGATRPADDITNKIAQDYSDIKIGDLPVWAAVPPRLC